MSGFMAVLSKDLRTEVRTKEVAPSMMLFGLVLVFLLTFALPPGAGRAPVPPPEAGAVATREIAGIFLWITILFIGMVGFARSAALEREGSRIEALVLAPIDPAGLYAAKAAANFVYLSAMQIVIVPIFILFFDLRPALSLFGIVPVVILGNVGLAAVGTLFGTASQYVRMREVLLPLLAFPILLPLILAASKLTSTLFTTGGFEGQGRWFVLMAAFDLSISAIGAVAFEYVIHE